MRRKVGLSAFVGGMLGWCTMLVGMTVYHLQGGRLQWNEGQSLPHGLYGCRPAVDALAPGMLVLFHPSSEAYAFITHVYGGREVPTLWMKQMMHGEGESLWVQGAHPKSWDSRHFGPILRSQIQSTCVAWWTWEVK